MSERFLRPEAVIPPRSPIEPPPDPFRHELTRDRPFRYVGDDPRALPTASRRPARRGPCSSAATDRAVGSSTPAGSTC
ncbi:hypothetical protein [Paludisphaera mucosa]|uniref:Uncharacterized protein n=1 Tax=Paludisphaera mucosa TaxID=3030827 RepID=A0ABT6FCE7_9BACT|nr:hypothetical protein [Paludisphaera mucosa]MDG3005050.1 hypothetical protein [Paludisphaera mucosa]